VLLRELVLLAALLTLYRWVRFLVRERTDVAFDNARRILEWEHSLLLDTEAALQRLVLPHRDLVVVLNRYYVSVHFAATVLFLVWAFARSLRDYRVLRRVLVLVTLSSLVLHVVFPLAPPRMMPGFVDTMARFGPNPYHSEGVREFANQYAAMPSLHVGWSLVVAYGVVRISRARLRWLVLVHPALTVLAVVLTANHYWLDGIVAAALVAWALWILCRQSERVPAGLRPVGPSPVG
jgi:hypothetical protein